MPAALRGLLHHARGYWPAYLLGALAVVGTNLCDLATTFVVRYAVDEIGGAPSGSAAARALRALAARSGTGSLALMGTALVLLVVGQGAFRYLWRRGFVMSSLRIARDLRGELYDHLQAQDHAYFDHARTGELLSVATADIEAMRMFLGIGLLLSVDTLLYYSLVPYLMFRIEPWVTLAVMAPLPLVPLLTSRMGGAVQRRFTACQEQLSALSARAGESMGGIAVVKRFVQEASEERAFRELSERSLESQIHLARVQSLFMPLLALMVSLELFLAMWFGGAAVTAGRLTAGALFQLLMLTLMLTFPMMELGWVLTLYQRGSASWTRYREVTDQPPRIADDPVRAVRRAVTGEIEFRGLCFTFPGAERPALTGVDLRVPQGTTVGLVGEVGSGKSALVRLVPRFYQAEEGMVRIDGADVRAFPLAVLRARVGYAPQHTFLFSASIEENIALGAPGATRAEVEQAAAIAGLEDDLAGFDRGYATLLGERGVNLSGGQRQRVAIARAVLRGPRILILDDCLSAVDTRTEALILERLRGVMAGRTCLVVAHRLSTVRHADLICVLSGGRIVERGTPDELLAAGGWYAETWRHQQLEAAYQADPVEAP